MQHTPYCELVGSLNYLAVATCPNLTFAVSHLSSFLDCYCPEHWTAAIRVLHYVKGTCDLALILGGTTIPSLLGHSDSDYANCLDTSHSISGYCFTLGSNVVSWSSKKQPHTVDSSCYAEYIVLHHATKELLFLCKLLQDLGFPPIHPTPLLCDNDAAYLLAEDHSHHANMKHIHVKYHSIHDDIVANLTCLTCIHSSDNHADIFMKPLAKPNFIHLQSALGLHICLSFCEEGHASGGANNTHFYSATYCTLHHPLYPHYTGTT